MPSAPNWNRLWADLLVEELVRNGVDQFCASPGSRSAPLVMAAAAHPGVTLTVHVDERGSVYHALGLARATGRPSAWITTSGTAAANGFPGVIEASADGIPLILLTADRPPELRDSAANQTIDQVRLFGGYARWFFDMPAPDATIDPALVLTTVDQAVRVATGHDPGPVHLNLMFREPLAPDASPAGGVEAGPVIEAWSRSSKPFTRHERPSSAGRPDQLADDLAGCERVMILAERLAATEAQAVLDLAAARAWPIVADVASQLRLGSLPGVIRFGDLLAPHADALPVPDAVVRVGRPGVSKRLEGWLERLAPPVRAVLADGGGRIDPTHRATHRVDGIVAACRALAREGSGSAGRPHRAAPGDWTDGSWCEDWYRADAAIGRGLIDRLEREPLSEPWIASTVSELLPASHGLYLASSMPVRDMNAFATGGTRPKIVAANRGASGIDGTLSTAAGLGAGLGGPITLVTGDLAFLHDLNGLDYLRRQPVVVVLINNDGGGVFSFLPVARHRKHFEPVFGTPHGLTFQAAASLYGIEYRAPADGPDFVDAYREACDRPASTIIEVRTDRDENRRVHDALLAEVATWMSQA